MKRPGLNWWAENFQEIMVVVTTGICGSMGGLLIVGSRMEEIYRTFHLTVGIILMIGAVAGLLYFICMPPTPCTLADIPPRTCMWGDASQVRLTADGFNEAVAPAATLLYRKRRRKSPMWYYRGQDGVLRCGHAEDPMFKPPFTEKASSDMVSLIFTTYAS